MSYQKPPVPKSASIGVAWSGGPDAKTATDWNRHQVEQAIMTVREARDTTSEILAERAKTYGDFAIQAQITQTLKASMAASPNWAKLRPYQRESLDMIAGKIARILNGDPNHRDSWEDIAGYARLVADNLQ